jgi:molybdopterin/thiamine biosynthesis adenylyltransferase
MSAGFSTTSPELHEMPSVPGPAFDAMRALDRAARATPLFEVEQDLGAAFRKLEVGFVGLGSVGMHAADAVMRLAPRRALCVDPARVKPESVLTHPCAPADVGRSKARVVAERAKAISPETRVEFFEGAFEVLPIEVLAGLGCIVLASDNLAAEAQVGRVAQQLGIPLLQGSVFGPTLTAQCRVFGASPDAAGPCPCCLFGEEWDALDRGVVFSCQGSSAGAGRATPERAAAPTVSPPFLCAIAAQLTVVELARQVVGISNREESRLVDYCGFQHRTTVTRLERNPSCPQNHRRVRVERVGRDLGEITPDELLSRAGYGDEDPRRVTLTADGYFFASLLACECTTHPMLARFLPEDGSLGRCPTCHSPFSAHPLHRHVEVPAQALEHRRHRSLASTGAPLPEAVWVRGDRGDVLFCPGRDPEGTREDPREGSSEDWREESSDGSQ